MNCLRFCCVPSTVLVLTSLLVVEAAADIRLPGVFSDNMVLQRGDKVRIWGSAEPGETLKITLGDSSCETTADEAGNWTAWVVPPPAGGPYELVIAGTDAQVVFSDVLVGEVWLCSGQSNMQWSMKQSTEIEDPDAWNEHLGGLVDSNIRMLTVPANAVEEPARNFSQPTGWQTCSPDVISDFSATAFYFARALRESERLGDVPIGLIDSSWGGTPGEAWVSRAALDQQESLAPLLTHWDEISDNNRPQHRPGNLFNGMIAPLIPYNIRGVIWYQGEANVGRARQYVTILKTLIEDWRARFGQGDFPFYIVELAPFRYGNRDPQALAELWIAQQAATELPNVAIAPSTDIGNPADIHPKNKETVGQRLGNIARNRIYGETGVPWAAPRYRCCNRVPDTNQMTIQLDAAEGLHCSGDAPGGFLICAADGNFVPAQARIENDQVIVWSDDVADPVAVRYLWNDTASGDLFNAAGLPVLPFRTDDFQLLSRDRHF